MKLAQMFAVSAMLLGALAVTACDDDDDGAGGAGGGTTATGTGGGTTATGTGGGTTGAGGGTTGAGGSTGAGMPMNARARVAHLSPDTAPVDFCVRAQGSMTWIGPVMSTMLNDANGLAYAEVTRYLDLPASVYTVRLVAPGQTTCTTALPGTMDVTDLVFASGTSYTAAALGMQTPAAGDEPFRLALFPDVAMVAQGLAAVRFIHASPDAPAVDVGILGMNNAFTPLFTNVAFGNAGSVNGGAYYQATLPSMQSSTTLDLQVRPSGSMTAVLDVADAMISAGDVYTIFAIGNVDGTPQALRALVCNDTEAGSGALSSCAVTGTIPAP